MCVCVCVCVCVSVCECVRVCVCVCVCESGPAWYHSPAVLTERMNALPAVLVPQLHGLIIAGRHDQTPVRGKPTGELVRTAHLY